MKQKLINTLSFTSLAITVMAAQASAAVVLQPTAASTDMGELFSATRARNLSGLSIGYTSLDTDFDTYIASGPTAVHGGGSNLWGATLGVRSGNFDFALGGTYLVSGMAFWNLISDVSSVRQFTLLLDDNASFSSATNLGTFTASNSLGSGLNTAVQVFTFSETSASFARLQILNTWSASSNHTVFNEAAFRVAAVPEPSSAFFEVIGCSVLLLRRTRNRQSA